MVGLLSELRPYHRHRKNNYPRNGYQRRHDMQVLPTSNLTVIKGLLKSKNEKNFFKEYPELNHLFQHCKLNNALDYYKIEETCSPEVLSDIANWINSL